MSKLSNLERCSVIQRKILIHSILYYEMNKTILTDAEFDKMCRKLLIGKEHTKNYHKTDYFYVFYDFDGSTGFDLYDRLEDDDKEYLTHLAQLTYRIWESKNKSKRKSKNG